MLQTVLLLAAAIASCRAGLIMLPTNILPIDPAGHQTTTYTKPWFCHDLECPKYSVLETNDACRCPLNRSLSKIPPLPLLMGRLKDYMSSEVSIQHASIAVKDKDTKIPMTAPVVTEVFHGQGPDCESNFTKHFMMPFNMQANPPTPTDSSVFIKRVDAFNAIVKSYGGFSTDEIKRQKLEEFIQDLDAANKRYADNVFLTAGYDGPYQFSNRHNELWVVAL